MMRVAKWTGLILFAVVALLVIGSLHGCAHSVNVPQEHNAAGCLAVCESASYVETNVEGTACRCWIHSTGFQYTFPFPTTEAGLLKSRSEWRNAQRTVESCKKRGMAWTASPDKTTVICLEPDEPEKEGEPESDDPPSPVDPHPETKA